MVLEVPCAPTADALPSRPGEAEALIEEARRLRRRRRRRYGVAAALGAAGLLALVGVWSSGGGAGGGGGGQGAARPERTPSASATRAAPTAPAGGGAVGRGPTAVDLTDPRHAWIASGNVALPQANPTIVHTTDGGRTWERTPVPNLAAQTVDSQTRFAFGGLVGIHFADAERGWFFQAGMGWQTNDAGSRWTTVRFPRPGALVALTSSGGDVWALLDSCPGPGSCPPSRARGFVYHARSAARLTWQRVGGALPAGYAAIYPRTGRSVVVAFGLDTYRRTLGTAEPAGPAAGCQTVGPLAGGALAGVCGGGGGGDASVSRIAVSDDRGASWRTLVGGPPSQQWMGTVTTDGSDAVFDVTGGQVLWRTAASPPGWQAVLEVPASSTDEIAAVSVAGAHGYVLVSDGLDAHWFETNDGGTTWEPTTLP